MIRAMMRHGRNLMVVSALSLTLALGGCASFKRPQRVDGKVVLEELGSPEVEGFDATLVKSAQAAEEAGDYARAAQAYAQLVDRDGKNIDYLKGFAENSRRSGRNDVALVTYDTILKLDDSNIDALEGKGLALLDVGESQKAGDVLAKVMQQDKTRWKTLNALAILFVMKERHDDAMAYFVEALERSPNNVSVLNNVGLTMAIENKLEDAVEALKKAGRLASEDARLRKKVDLNLAMVYGVKGELDKARKVASKHLSGAALNNNMGFYAHLAKDDVLAKSYLNMALSGAPHYYERAWENLDTIKKQENETQSKGKFGGGKRVKVK